MQLQKGDNLFTSRSSALSPVSCKLTKKFLVFQQLDAHYKKISQVKSSIDNKCPKSLQCSVLMRDRVNRQLRERRKSANNQNGYNSKPMSARSRSSLDLNFKHEVEQSKFVNDVPPVEFDDILDKHKERFTEQKPYTPRILKAKTQSKFISDESLKLCYNPPITKNQNVTSRKQHDNVKINERKKTSFSENQINEEPKKIPNERINQFLYDLTMAISHYKATTERLINQIFADLSKEVDYLNEDEIEEAYQIFWNDWKNDQSDVDHLEKSHINSNYSAVPNNIFDHSMNSREDDMDSRSLIYHLEDLSKQTNEIKIENNFIQKDITNNKDVHNKNVKFSSLNDEISPNDTENNYLTDVTSISEMDNDTNDLKSRYTESLETLEQGDNF